MSNDLKSSTLPKPMHHEHVHDHNHEECGCSHDHSEHTDDHNHEGECGCGHDHGEHTHDHHHEEECGCGHDHGEHIHDHHHEEECGCGHDHGEHIHHPQYVDVSNTLGHPPECQCEHCHPHTAYCDVCGESLANCTCAMPDDGFEKKVYLMENLGCANCAAKMETKIKALDGVKYASVTFATKQLRLSAQNHSELLPVIQDICTSIESDVRVVPRTKSPGVLKIRTYLLENLGCANCAAKMERQISQLPEVSSCTITFATKQLRVTAADPDALLEKIGAICASIESEVLVVPKPETASAEKNTKKSHGDRNALASICIGALLFIVGEVCERIFPVAAPFIFIIAYLVLGLQILVKAGKNLLKGQIFDENFLMSIATLGAFAIQQFPEAVGVMLFYRIGEYFEHRAVEKSRGQIMDAVDLRPEVVNLIVGEDVRVIQAENAQVGDILMVRPGDRIPLDGVVLEGESRIDTSPITGEPVPVGVTFGSEVLSGCVNTSGTLKIRVEKVLEESMVTRILDSVENAAASKPKLDRFITRFARIYTPIVLVLAILVAVVPSLITGNWHYWIYTALTFLVISCPCALVLSVPLAFFSGIGAGSKKGILFKGGVTLEALNDVKTVVMDKTGTITQGNFVVQKLLPAPGIKNDELLELAACCEINSTHPIAGSIVAYATEQNVRITRPTDLQEVAGQGIIAQTTVGQILCGNRKLMEANGVSLSDNGWEISGTEVLVARNGIYVGALVIADTVKADAREAIAKLKKSGRTTAMLTGDAENRAQEVADSVGIDQVHARLLPQDKVGRLQQIRENSGAVLFVGDGINDAPVLAAADVSAAMGSGADAAIEVADVVFMTSDMGAVPDSFDIASDTVRIAKQNVVFALAIKVIVMALGLMGYASMWMAVFADTGVSLLCVLNSIRVLYKKR